MDFAAYAESHHHIKNVELRIQNNHSNPYQTIFALDALFLLDSDFLSNKKEYHTILFKKHWKNYPVLLEICRKNRFGLQRMLKLERKLFKPLSKADMKNGFVSILITSICFLDVLT